MTTFTTHTFTLDETVAATTMQGIQDSIDAICPIGSYLMVHMTPPASGTLVNGAWLGCDGASVSASTYVSLFNTIGTTYGGGSGSFNLPDFRGRMPLVASASGAGLGQNDGAALASRRPTHSHSVSGTHSHTPSLGFGLDGAHNHTLSPYPSSAGSEKGTSTRNYTSPGGGTTSGVSANHYHNLSGALNSAATGVSAVGVAGLTDVTSYLVCCTVLIRAL